MTFELRTYQKECLDKIYSKINEGIRLQVCVLSTGAGKTVIFSQLPKAVKKSWKKTLIIAHREELLTQARDKILKTSPELTVEIEQWENTAEPTSDVVIASIQTIGRKGSNRIKKFNPKHYWLLIIDECQHCTEESTYANVLSYFWANKVEWVKEWHPVVLWFTATPKRRDNQGLDKLFDEVVFKYDIKQGIEWWYLARIKAFTINTNESLVGVSMRTGDFAIEELSNAVNTPERNALVVESYKKICDGEIAIVFAVDVLHAETLANCFKDSWIKADFLIWTTDKDKRRQMLKDFHIGKIKVMVNVWTLTEWYDNEHIKAVLLARPTTSSGLYLQMVWRWLRISEGKENVKILDFVDNLSKHSIISSSSIIWLEKPIKVNWEDLMDLQEKYEELLTNDPSADISDIAPEDLEARIKEVDIFKMAQLPDMIKQHSGYARTPFLDWFKLNLGKNEQGSLGCEIREDTLGQYEVAFYLATDQVPSFRNSYKKSGFTKLHSFICKDKIQAIERADLYIFQHHNDRVRLVSQNASRREWMASDKQISILKKFGISGAERLNKGEAANLLNKIFAERSAKRK